MSRESSPRARAPWQETLHEVIFEAETPSGKTFDVALLVVIVLSVLSVMLESVEYFNTHYGSLLRAAEWTFTVLFTIEYVLRMLTVARPIRYATSFFGLVDLLSVLPSYVSLLIPGSQTLLIVRALRLLRIFRVFKLGRYLKEADVLLGALRASSAKITVFLGTVLTVALIMGSLMYLIEGAPNGFSSIPRSTYWAIVTMTTVGYGDIAPTTAIGQTLAAILMIMGYSILAVPTGIVSVEIAQAGRNKQHVSTRACGECSAEGHDHDADFCKHCGAPLKKEAARS